MPGPAYADLRAADRPIGDADAAFDQHVLAAILAIAAAEPDGLAAGTGLAPAALDPLLATFFPALPRAALAYGAVSARSDEENLLVELLTDHAADTEAAAWLAVLVARRAMRPDHLWQDLGLNDRAELGRLLARHFPTLAAGNSNNMRWKKYFYRVLCEAEGFVLCTAPSCAVCCDFSACFGAEDGMSRLATTRRALEIAA